MIVRNRPHALAALFALKGSIVPRIGGQLAVLTVFYIGVTALHGEHLADLARYSTAPFTLLGVTLSVILGFRNNASYERWWEGRKQWGQLVDDIRGLARSSETLLGEHPQRRELLNWVRCSYHALRGQLRRESVPGEVWQHLPSDHKDAFEQSRNHPDYCLRQAGKTLGVLYRSGELDSQSVRILDEHLSRMSELHAACERLASTPLPFAYSLLTHRITFLYAWLLPFGLVGNLGWLTPVFSLLVAYTLFALDALSGELEQPFGHKPNDLPLDALCRVNDISIAEALGDPAPEPLAPVDHVLT